MDNEKNGRILIIDDEKMNIIALAQFLKPQYEVIVALNGGTGLEIAEKQQPDLILLDVLMPDMSGFEVIKKLKTTDKIKDIPVIFISGLDSEEDKKNGLSLGAVDYIFKPFTRTAVQSKVDKHFKQS